MNLPNKISTVRIALIPVFAALFYMTFIPYNYIFAAVVFAIAALSDFLDGYIARKYNLVTTLGKFLDPIADKLLVTFSFIMLLTVDLMPTVISTLCVCVIISRELLISALRQIAAAKNVVLAADIWGKFKTLLQDLAILVLLVALGFCTAPAFAALRIIGLVLFFAATAMTIVSAVNYVVKNIGVFND